MKKQELKRSSASSYSNIVFSFDDLIMKFACIGWFKATQLPHVGLAPAECFSAYDKYLTNNQKKSWNQSIFKKCLEHNEKFEIW